MTKKESEWVSLREASDLLGVHPATVRAWADKGELPSIRTPGGHRRFNRQELKNRAGNRDDFQPVEIQVIIQNALGQARLRIEDGDLTNVPWYTGMSEETRAQLRQFGRSVLESLRQYLARGAADDDLAQAIQLGHRYAKTLSEDGLTLPQATRGFYYFSDFVVNAMLTWSELSKPRSSSEWAVLMSQVNAFTNAMLLSIIEYYEEE
ncbi:helix-turn-helix domain-containing protein [Anaerolineales bacterium]